MKLEEGATLAAGRYRLESLRGRGGMAMVWRAHDTQLDRPVAIKVIADSLAADPEFRRRFEREARAAAAVSHAHVVKLFDYGLEDDRPYLVMEYIEGPNLAEMQKDGSAASLELERLANDLLEAVCQVHKAGVLHRDVKPANLLFTAAGDVRLTDFGIARLDETTQITRAGMIVGTERYIAPEVAAGEPATPASDLYSVGAVLHELLGPSTPPRVRDLVDLLRSSEPASRPASAEAALEILRAGGVPGDDADTARLPGAAEGTEAETARLAGRPAPAGPPGTTGATAVLPGARRERTHLVVERGDRRLRVSPVAAAAALAALATIALLLGLALAGGDSAPEVPAPAPETAPLGEQIDQLDRIVRSIAEDQAP